MKDITLKIVGKQLYENKEEDQMEFVTDGKIYQRNGAVYVIYDDSELSGMAGCKTTLKFKPDSVKMKRMGQSGIGTELYFEKGKRFISVYDTPYGMMDIEVLTSHVNNNFDFEELKGNIAIEYDISLSGNEAKNKLTIDVS